MFGIYFRKGYNVKVWEIYDLSTKSSRRRSLTARFLEISRVRGALFQTEFVTEPFDLPEPIGDVVTITEKIYVPKREYPDVGVQGNDFVHVWSSALNRDGYSTISLAVFLDREV